MCALIIKLLKIGYTFCTKLFKSTKNHYHHGKKNQCKEVEYGYIFVNISVKSYYLTNYFSCYIIKKVWLFEQSFLWYISKQSHSNDW